MSRAILIAPSVLAADFGHLADDLRAAEQAGADRIHFDVMDGHFVPNLSIGVPVLEAVRKATGLPIEVHLMIERPELFLDAFAAAGADLIEVQVEASYQLYRVLSHLRELGVKPGVALNPATPVEALAEVVELVDLVNVMTVEPGFGGQAFIPSSPSKVARVRAMRADVDIEVDGGIDATTAPLAVAAGANVLVAGTSVFRHPGGIAAGIRGIRDVTG